MRKMYKVEIADSEYFRRNIPCTYACPVNTPAGRYVQSIFNNEFEDAYWLARSNNPFVYSCGRICAAPCESECRRKHLDDPISIRALKRTATDNHNLGLGHSRFKEVKTKNGRKVAVIGSGPSGLSCAHDLALFGYDVTVFEQSDKVGGMLDLGIPVFRLPRDVLNMEINSILSPGIKLKLNTRLGREIDLQSLKDEGFEAFYLAIGATKSKELQIKGIEYDGVINAIEFLINANSGYNMDIGKNVIIIGGGNVAIDVARQAIRNNQDNSGKSLIYEENLPTLDSARWALRMGAKSVSIVCLEPRDQMPAYLHEVIEAEKEGIKIFDSRGPLQVTGDNGKASGLEVMKCSSIFNKYGEFNPEFIPGSEETISADTIILAIGQDVDLSFLRGDETISKTGRGTIKIEKDNYRTSMDGVFSGGDAAFGPRLVIEAVRDGKTAALSIHQYLTGAEITGKAETTMDFTLCENNNVPYNYDSVQQQKIPSLPVERRIGIAEVEVGYDNETAIVESSRCLKCQINTIFDSEKCILCGGCVDICPNFCLEIIPVKNMLPDSQMTHLLNQREADWALVKDETICIRCGLCANRCPADAITMEAFEEALSE